MTIQTTFSAGMDGDDCIDTLNGMLADTLESYGVSAGASAAVNTAAFNTCMLAVEAAGGGHVSLKTPGTYLLETGVSATHQLLRACILIPSHTTLELGPGVRLKIKDGHQAYVIRNSDPVNGNVNIEFFGGIVDGNYDGNPGPGAPGEFTAANVDRPYYGFLGRWENIVNLYHHDQESVAPAIWAWNGVRLHDATFSNMLFTDCTHDGIHLHDSTYVTIRGLRGECGDNMIALSTSEGQYWWEVDSLGDAIPGTENFKYNDGTGDLVQGNLENILIEDIQCTNSNGPVRLFGNGAGTVNGITWGASAIKHITIRGVRGTTHAVSIGGVQIVQDGTCAPQGCEIDHILIEDINLETQTYEPQVNIGHNTCRNITIRNINVVSGRGVLVEGSGFDSIIIDGVVNGGGSTDHLLTLGGSIPLTAKSLRVSNLHFAGTTTGSARLIQATEDLTIGNFELESACFNGVSDATLIQYQGAVRQTINLGKLSIIGGGLSAFFGLWDVEGGDVYTHTTQYLSIGKSRLNLNTLRIANGANGHMGTIGGTGGSLFVKRQVIGKRISFTEVNSPAANGGSGGTGFFYSFVSFVTLPRGAVIVSTDVTVITAAVGSAGTFAVARADTTDKIGGLKDAEVIGRLVSVLDSSTVAVPNGVPVWTASANPQLIVFFTTGSSWTLSAGEFYVMVEYMILGQEH